MFTTSRIRVARLISTALPSMPTMSDSARKRSVADWVIRMKRQVVKLYAIAKWSRDAAVVQKAMVRPFLSVDILLVPMHAFRTLLRSLWIRTSSSRMLSWPSSTAGTHWTQQGM